MYIIKTNLEERMLVAQIMPQQGNYIDNLVNTALSKKLEIKNDELDEYEITSHESGFISWNEKGKTKIFEIELTDREYDFLERVLQTASDKGILPIRLMQLFITICKPELPEDLK
jgi:hypothetical protein